MRPAAGRMGQRGQRVQRGPESVPQSAASCSQAPSHHLAWDPPMVLRVPPTMGLGTSCSSCLRLEEGCDRGGSTCRLQGPYGQVGQAPAAMLAQVGDSQTLASSQPLLGTKGCASLHSLHPRRDCVSEPWFLPPRPTHPQVAASQLGSRDLPDLVFQGPGPWAGLILGPSLPWQHLPPSPL